MARHGDGRGARIVALRVLRGVAAHPGRLPARRHRLLRRAVHHARPVAPAARAHHQHLERLQRLRRSQPLHARHQGVVRPAHGPRLPAQARRPRQPRGRRRRPRPGHARPRHLPPRPPVLAVGWFGGLAQRRAARSCSGPRPRATSSTTPSTPTSRRCPGCSTVAASTCRSDTTSTGRGRCATRSSSSCAAGGNAAFLSGNTSFWQVRFEDDESDDRVTRTSSPRTRCTTPTASTCSPRCGPTT